MAGRRYVCVNCGAVLWRNVKTKCFSCGGEMVASKNNIREDSICVICGTIFTPKWCTEKTCSPECSKKLELRNARERAAKNYALKKQNGAQNAHKDYRKPWQWLLLKIDDAGGTSERRTILHTLEDQTRAGAWPWPDVLAGDGPCIMDECPC